LKDRQAYLLFYAQRDLSNQNPESDNPSNSKPDDDPSNPDPDDDDPSNLKPDGDPYNGTSHTEDDPAKSIPNFDANWVKKFFANCKPSPRMTHPSRLELLKPEDTVKRDGGITEPPQGDLSKVSAQVLATPSLEESSESESPPPGPPSKRQRKNATPKDPLPRRRTRSVTKKEQKSGTEGQKEG